MLVPRTLVDAQKELCRKSDYNESLTSIGGLSGKLVLS